MARIAYTYINISIITTLILIVSNACFAQNKQEETIFNPPKYGRAIQTIPGWTTTQIDSDRITHVQGGEFLTILSSRGKWYKVLTSKAISCWMRADYIKIEDNGKEKERRRLEIKVKPIPSSDIYSNLSIYKELLNLYPENDRYKKKVDHYSKKLRTKKKTPTQNNFVSMQQKRKQFIQEMVENKIFYKVERQSDYLIIWIAPAFYGLPYENKSSFINVVYAYFITQNKKYDYITLKDSRTGKIVGGYAEKIGGLKLD